MQPLSAALVGAALGVVGVRLSLRWSARSSQVTSRKMAAKGMSCPVLLLLRCH